MPFEKRLVFTTLCGGLLTVVVAQGIARFGYTPILPLMQEAEDFGSNIGGYIASINYWGYLIGALLATYLSNSPYRLSWFRISIIIIVSTTALMGITNDLISWSVIRFFSGLAGGISIVLGATLTQESIKPFNIKNWAGIYFSGVGIGIVITGMVVLLLSSFLTWQQQWLILSAISIILAAFILPWVKSTNSKLSKHSETTNNAKWPLSVWLLIVAYFLNGLGYVASVTFLVSIILSLPGLESWGNQVWILVGAAAAPSCILWAYFSKKHGEFKPLIIIYLLQSISIIIPIFIGGMFGAILGGLLFGATFLSAISLSFNLASYLAPKNTGRLLGTLTTVFGAGQIISPAVSGWLIDRTGTYNLTLILSSSAIGIAAILLILSYLSHSKGMVKHAQLKLR